MTGVVAAFDSETAKLALVVPLLPSVTDTSEIDIVGAVGGVAVPIATPLTLMFVGADPTAPGVA